MSKFHFITHRIRAGIRDEGGLIPAAAKAIGLLVDGGVSGLLLGDAYVPGRSYADWVSLEDSLDDDDRERARHELSEAEHLPKISILLPTYETDLAQLRAAVNSVERQIYPNWELCIADDASKSPDLSAYLSSLKGHARVKVTVREENGHISACSNTALSMATGSWVVLLDHDDQLSEDALLEIYRVVSVNPRVRMIYSDEDKLDRKGRRCRPYFKPQFNLELLRGNNYICHLACYRREELLELGGFRLGFEGAQDHDLALRYCERLTREEVHRIPKVLYHWREHAGSTSTGVGVKSYALDSGVRAVESHLERVGVAGRVQPSSRGYYTVVYEIPTPPPKVTIIIPTRNQLGLLRTCIESIRARTTYTNYELLVVDNGSDCPETLAWLAEEKAAGALAVLRDAGPFNFARLNNSAVKAVTSEFVLLLNNDVEVLSEDWLDGLVATASQDDVGAVGAKLLYEDGAIQHVGVIGGIGGSAGHAFKGARGDSLGYYFRAAIRSEFSAVTGACLLVRRDKYLAVGGLDEAAFGVAFNDVDLCWKLHAAGYRNIVCPDAQLIHYESKSRGYEDNPDKQRRFAVERARLRWRWQSIIDDDPAYNPNLSRDDEFFTHERRFSMRTQTNFVRAVSPDDFDGLMLNLSPEDAPLVQLLKLLDQRPLIYVALCGCKDLAVQLASVRPTWLVQEWNDVQCDHGMTGHADTVEKLSQPVPDVDLFICSQACGCAPSAHDGWMTAMRSSGVIVYTLQTRSA